MQKKILFIIFWLNAWAISYADTAKTCHPTVDSAQPQYIIGYGSLIQKESKNRTEMHTGENFPILLSGFKRGWFTRGFPVGFSSTYLGVVEDQKSVMNGVIFKINSKKIANFDDREKFYCRVSVQPQSMKMLNHLPIPKGQFWIYTSMPESIEKPSKKYPILQSYVDIFLSGCLEIEKQYQLENFADTCVETTSDWSTYWINDRIHPRRPTFYQPLAPQIDKILENKIPEFFHSIKIE